MPRRFWSADDKDRLKELYPHRPTGEIATALARALSAVYRMATILRLTKSPEFLASDESGRLRKGMSRPGSQRTQFKKGQVPANKGLRRPGWGPGRMKETQFRKGELSGAAARNWHPIGSILPDPEGYLRIKVRDAIHGKEATGFGNTKVWPLYNRFIWQRERGPIPDKHMVVFKDGDRRNCQIENLELISMADNASRNGLWARFPRELAEAIQLNGALKRKMRNLHHGKEQN